MKKYLLSILASLVLVAGLAATGCAPVYAASSSGIVDKVFIQKGTGAVSRVYADKLTDIVSAKDFGAKGDGVTNDTAAIQRAIDSRGGLGGSRVYLPAGTYILAPPCLKLPSGTQLFGAGKMATILTNSATCSFIAKQGGVAENIVIRDMGMKANFQYDRLVDFSQVTRSEVSGVKFTRGPASGINLGYGVYGDASGGVPGYDNDIRNNEFSNMFIGVYLSNAANAWKITGNTFELDDYGVYVDTTVSTTRIVGNRAEAATVNLFHIQGEDTEIHYNYLETYVTPATSGSIIYMGASALRTNIGSNYISALGTATAITDVGVKTTYVDVNKTQHSGAILPTGSGGKVISTAGNTTLTIDSQVVVVNAGAAAVMITLPPSSALPGQIIEVKKVDGGANAVTVAKSGTDKIDGADSFVITAQYKYVRLRSDGGGNWYIFGSN